MTPEDYERERLRLEDQLRADIELLQAAHRTRLRALEAIWKGEDRGPEMSTALPPSPRPEPPAPSTRRRKSGAWELDDAVFSALDDLGEEFTKEDLLRVLGFKPNRSSLHRVLRRLEGDGLIVTSEFGAGRRGTRYKKVET